MSADYEYEEDIEIEEELDELRGRRWRRDRNRVTARRKYYIYTGYGRFLADMDETDRPEHYFVKGKCHCSCTGCSIHTNAKHSRKQVYYGMWDGGTMNYKHGEMMNHLEMKDRLREYIEEAA